MLCGAPACGHIGIDLGDDGVGGIVQIGPTGGSSTGGSDAEPATGGTDNTGGQDASSGGGTAGGDTGGGGGSGGEGSGGDEGSGGVTSGGGGEPGGSGGDGAGGDGAGGSGGSGDDCGAEDVVCAELAAQLLHRYSFNGAGTSITDELGGPSGTIFGTSLNGSGELTFLNAAQFATMPPGIVTETDSVSIEVWFVWNGGEQWQKVFEFGSAGPLNNPTSYLYVSPEGGGGNMAEHAIAAGIRLMAGGDRQLRTMNITATGVPTHVVLVADSVAGHIGLYKNGAWLGKRDVDIDLNQLQDNSSRLGRSLFPDDPAFLGSIQELRIYGDVLSADAVAKSYALGPDAPLDP